MTDDRSKQIIKRIEDVITAEGVIKKKIYHSMQYGMGTANSYFEALVDIRLEGKTDPKSQEIWEEMKAHVNYLTRNLVKASEDYAKLETKVRGLEQDIRDMILEENKRMMSGRANGAETSS